MPPDTHPAAHGPGLDDSDDGNAMFAIFTGAVLLVTGVIWLVAVVHTWWMLAIGFAIHVGFTTVVVIMIQVVMDGRRHGP